MQRYGGVGGIAPPILNLGNRLTQVDSFTSQPVHPGEKNPGTQWIEGWVGLRAGLDAVAKQKSYSAWNRSLVVQPVP
jgi:hypothetical protein